MLVVLLKQHKDTKSEMKHDPEPIVAWNMKRKLWFNIVIILMLLNLSPDGVTRERTLMWQKKDSVHF